MKKLLGQEHGAAIIEFALVTPLLLALVWGIIETGRAFYTVNMLASAVRDGARYAATCQLGPAPITQTLLTGSTCESTLKSIVVNSFQPLGPALTNSDVSATVAGIGGDRIEVQATYQYSPIVPLGGWTFPMTRQATFRYERLP